MNYGNSDNCDFRFSSANCKRRTARCDQRKDKRAVDLTSDALPFGRLWYGEPNAISNAIDYANSFSRSYDAAIHVYDEAGNVIESHKH